ncbi:ABC transporter substrate-binding protein [Leptothrix sp. BB-4]
MNAAPPTAPTAATRIGRRRLLAGAWGLGCAGWLTACSEPIGPLRLGSIVFPTYEYAFLARELGWLDDRKVRLIELPANTYSLRALAAHQLDACQLTLDEVLTAREAGIDLAVVMVLDISAGADAVYARRPMALAEIKGKRIAVETGATGALMLDGLLEAAGLDLAAIRTLPITLDRSAEAYQQGEADLVVSAQPWSSRIEAMGGVRLFDSRAIPNLIVDVLAVRREVLDPQAESLRQVVSALLGARQHQAAQPVDAAMRMAPRLQMAAADVPEVFMGLRIPGLAENRELLAPGGALQHSAADLMRRMQAHGLLRLGAAGSRPGRPMTLGPLLDARFLPASLATPA